MTHVFHPAVRPVAGAVCVMLAGVVLAGCSAWILPPGSATQRGDSQLTCDEISSEVTRHRDRMAVLLSETEPSDEDNTEMRALQARERVLQKLARGRECPEG